MAVRTLAGAVAIALLGGCAASLPPECTPKCDAVATGPSANLYNDKNNPCNLKGHIVACSPPNYTRRATPSVNKRWRDLGEMDRQQDLSEAWKGERRRAPMLAVRCLQNGGIITAVTPSSGVEKSEINY